MFLPEIQQLIIGAGVLSCIASAIEALFRTEHYRYSGATAALATAVFLLYAYFNIAGLSLGVGYLNYLFVVPLFAVGPAVFILVKGSVTPDNTLSRYYPIFYAPTVLVSLILPTVYYSGVYDFSRHPMPYFRGEEFHLVDLLFVGSLVYGAVFYSYILLISRSIFSVRSNHDSGLAFLFITLFLMGSFCGIATVLTFPLQEEAC